MWKNIGFLLAFGLLVGCGDESVSSHDISNRNLFLRVDAQEVRQIWIPTESNITSPNTYGYDVYQAPNTIKSKHNNIDYFRSFSYTYGLD